MRAFVTSLATAAVLAVGAFASAPALAAPASVPLAIGDAAAALDATETVQYYHGGRRHCWYDDGWRGPGWYWCGYQRRHGYGWGGPLGWLGWSFGRPHHHHHHQHRPQRPHHHRH